MKSDLRTGILQQPAMLQTPGNLLERHLLRVMYIVQLEQEKRKKREREEKILLRMAAIGLVRLKQSK